MNNDFMDNKVQLNIINTNARSLRPKIPSLIRCFLNLALTFAIVTETWFSSGGMLEKQSEDLLLGHGLVLHALNRPPSLSGASHGGVAVIARDSCTKSSIIKFANPEAFEVLPVLITLPDVIRKIHVIAAYIPPNYPVPRARQCMQHISDLVLHVKNAAPDPLILVAGDFNQWNIGDYLAEYSDLQEVTSPPTRGTRHIDKMFTNWPDEVVESGCITPLEAEHDGDSTWSDHQVQYLCSRVPRKEPVKWEVFSHRPITKSGEISFLAELEGQDWSLVLTAQGPNAKVGAFHSIIQDLTDRHFPLKITRRKESDLPWLDARARKMIKRKAAIFKSEGPSERWERARNDVDRYLDGRREKYVAKQREKFTGPNASAHFHKNVKAFCTAEKPKPFDVRTLLPGRSDGEVADEIANYFNAISREFSPLQPCQIPFTYDRPLDYLAPGQVEKMIRAAKKPSSTVKGDLPPSLVNAASKAISSPVADIFNEIIRTLVWPIEWKREYVTVIPKKPMPESLADLRNISCTPFLSKVFESYVMKRAQEEITLKNNQFGGVKGCSTTHLIVELLQEMCENAEDYRSATVLAAIDYSKAFNRVSFQHCLEAFRKKGASTSIIRLIASFLTNRTMSVRVGQHWSCPLDVNGGCPQGSVLGVLLFNTTTDDLEDDFLEHERNRLQLPTRGQAPESPPRPTRPRGIEFAASTPTTTTGRAYPQGFSEGDVSPVHPGGFGPDHVGLYRPELPYVQVPQPVLHQPPPSRAVGTQVLVEKQVRIVKYVDDNIVVAKLNFGDVPLQPGPPPIKRTQAIPTQNAFRSITGNAMAKGMLVNTKKTNLLCISDAMSYTPHTYIEDTDGTVVESTDSMKVLGFHFSNKPTVHLHVNTTVKRIRQRYWTLRHLSKFGMNKKELVDVYTSVVRPLADYCAPAYHSMMTDVQDQEMERAQTGALRAIFGYGESARKLREAANIQTLRARRIELTDKFARKCASNPRFNHWFPLNTGRRSARNNDKYEEKYARTDRLKNSPLYYMRRRLNGKEGKIYGERNRTFRENFNI